MGGKSDDFGDVAAAQGVENEGVVTDQLYANRPTQYTPWGYTNWTNESVIDPGSNQQVTKWSQTQGLTPELQDILNKQIAVQGGRTDIAGQLTGRMGQEFGAPIDYSGLTPMGQVPTSQFTIPEDLQRNMSYEGLPGITNPQQQTQLSNQGLQDVTNTGQQGNLDYSGIEDIGDPNAFRQRAEDAVYNQAASRLGTQYDSKRNEMEIKMRNQGLAPEDEVWRSQMEGVGNQETDAYAQAQYNATQQGMAEANQMFGQQMGRRGMYTNERDRQGNFANDAAMNQFGMQSGLRGQQFGERQAQGNFGNTAAQNQFGMESGMRDQYSGERERQAQFGNQAAGQAYNMAMGANQQNFGQAMQGSQYANQIRQQQMTEAMQKRGFSLNEINALLSGQQVNAPQMPNFAQAGVAQPAPIYTAAVDSASAANAANPLNALIGAAGSVGGAFAGNL